MAPPKVGTSSNRGEPKMDPTRAQGLLGFSSSRWMDPNTGMDPKDALDRALFDQMQKIQTKKRQTAKEKVQFLPNFRKLLKNHLAGSLILKVSWLGNGL